MRKTESRKISLPKEQEKAAVKEIVRYFDNERNEAIGNMDGMLILAFFMEKIAPLVYNQAINDTQKYMSDKIDDLYGLMF